MVEYLFILLVAGVPACIAYLGRGSRRFRAVVGAVNLALAFLVAAVAAAQLMADPPVKTAMASGFISVVLAVTALALRLPPDTDPVGGVSPPQGNAQVAQQPYPAPWGAPPQHNVPGIPGQGSAPGGAPPQQPWGPPGGTGRP
jgi:hypothetical protein